MFVNVMKLGHTGMDKILKNIYPYHSYATLSLVSKKKGSSHGTLMVSTCKIEPRKNMFKICCSSNIVRSYTHSNFC